MWQQFPFNFQSRNLVTVALYKITILKFIKKKKLKPTAQTGRHSHSMKMQLCMFSYSKVSFDWNAVWIIQCTALNSTVLYRILSYYYSIILIIYLDNIRWHSTRQSVFTKFIDNSDIASFKPTILIKGSCCILWSVQIFFEDYWSLHGTTRHNMQSKAFNTMNNEWWIPNTNKWIKSKEVNINIYIDYIQLTQQRVPLTHSLTHSLTLLSKIPYYLIWLPYYPNIVLLYYSTTLILSSPGTSTAVMIASASSTIIQETDGKGRPTWPLFLSPM